LRTPNGTADGTRGASPDLSRFTGRLYYSRVEFEWDDLKAASNEKKHGVSFEEARMVFDDPLARIFEDDDAVSERREIIIGHSDHHRLLLVCFIERASTVRLISARMATRREREDYEKNVLP
jgi:uncharacterized DUF497 family protein